MVSEKLQDTLLLELKRLSKLYGAVRAVNDVSLSVSRGEFFGLLGPSGCGKTTTLRMIAGLEKPDEGTIEFEGKNISSLPPERRGFGMVFQNYALFPHLNVFENVAFGLRARHKSKSEIVDQVQSALELVQLPGYDKRHVDELSGGQQQRVAIARAIAIQPALLLFDEPLSNLDVSLRESTRGELRELVTRLKLTAVYVTHDQEEAYALCDRIAVMVGGRIRQIGKPQELYEHPAEISVAQFLGRNNVIKAMRLSSSKSETAEFKTLQGEHTLRLDLKREDSAPLNQPVFITIRPEHVQLVQNGNRRDVENSMTATVTNIVFAGATSLVKVNAQGLQLEALVLQADSLGVGTECDVVLSKSHLAILKSN